MRRWIQQGIWAGLALALAARAGANELNVELKVAERQGLNRHRQPVTAGVPLPEGAYEDVDRLRLVDADGNEIPCQIVPTVRWWRDGSVRWALLDFQAHVSAFSMRPFYLRDDGPPQPIENPVEIVEDDDRIVVTTGPLRFAVRKRGFNLIDEAWLDEEGEGEFGDDNRLVAPNGMSGPVLWSNFPNLSAYRIYRSANDMESVVTVEEQGPMRVVIKAVGTHLADDAEGPDDKLLDYVIRIHAYRGQRHVRVVYSAECKQGERIDQFVPVDRWHVVVPGVLGDDLVYSFGGESAPVVGRFGDQDRAWLVCDSANRYTMGGAAYKHSEMGALEGRPMTTKPWRFGYMDLSGSRGGIMMAMRWMWQNYPKGLFAYSDGTLHGALWPSFSRRTATVATEPRAHFFPGVSKTHEMLLHFHGPDENQGTLFELNAALQTPLFAQAPPEWYCEETRAFGKVASSNPNLYPPQKRWLVQAYDHFFEQNRRAMLSNRDFVRDTDAYGMFNFGDNINHITRRRRANVGERACPSDIHWDNNYYGYPHALIIQFARTGNMDYLELAEQASTHLQDVDIHCWHPIPDRIGAARYSAGPDHVRLYGRGDPVFTSRSYNHYKNQSLFERFWLLGDRRALEMGLLSADFARRHTTRGISQSRSIGHGIVGLLSAYETTLDKAYLDAARAIVEETRDFRRSSHGAWIDGIALEGHRAWYELTGDERAIETVMGGADAARARPDRAGAILHAYAFAYGQTGNEDYRDLVVSGLRQNTRGRQASMMRFGNRFRNTGYLFWYLSNTLPSGEPVPEFPPE